MSESRASTWTPRVTHVVPQLFGHGTDAVVGGAERYALELARHMAERTPTTLVTFGERAREDRIGALRVKTLDRVHYVRGSRGNPLAPGLVRAVLDADVVHCHQQHILTSSLVAAFARLTRRRVFVTDLGGGNWDISAYVSTDRWYHGHLHISAYSRRIHGQEALSRAHVILGGVDTEKFSPDPSITRSGEALFVGRLMRHKGVDYLVQAAGADLPLRLIGQPYDGPFVAHLTTLAAGKPVTFEQEVNDEALVASYRRALCVVLPSVYDTWGGDHTNVPELLGQTLLEGMACGTPVICTAVASMPEIVVDGKTGFIVPPNDAAALGDRLRWLRTHPREADAMGAAGRAHVQEHFTWPQVVERCMAWYAKR